MVQGMAQSTNTENFTLSGLKHRRIIIFCNSVNVLFNSSGNGKFWGSLLSYIFCHSPIFSETWLLEKKKHKYYKYLEYFFKVYQRQITLYCHLTHFICTSESNPTIELLHAEEWKISSHHAAKGRLHLKSSKLTITSVCSSSQHCLDIHRSRWTFCLHYFRKTPHFNWRKLPGNSNSEKKYFPSHNMQSVSFAMGQLSGYLKVGSSSSTLLLKLQRSWNSKQPQRTSSKRAVLLHSDPNAPNICTQSANLCKSCTAMLSPEFSVKFYLNLG